STGGAQVSIHIWRDGRTGKGQIPAGDLGAEFASQPAETALAAWRTEESKRQAGLRGATWDPLPGSLLEAAALLKLLPGLKPGPTVLLGSEASEQSLDALAQKGGLKSYRLLHLATHGQTNPLYPEQTALILAQDRLPVEPTDAVDAYLAGRKPLD